MLIREGVNEQENIETRGVPSEVIEIFGQLKRADRLGLPKYRRLEQTILECIRQGHWRPGDRLPAEEQLTDLTPYSLGTVQRAMRQLTADGIIERRHGDGSYVRAGMKLLDDPWHCRFVDRTTDSILPVSSRALVREPAEDGPWRRHFEPDAVMVRLDRLISVSDEFLIFSRFYFDSNTVSVLAEAPLEELDGTNFRKLVNEQSRLPITQIDREISFTAFDEETRTLLGPTAGNEGLCLLAIARSGKHSAVFYQEFFIPRTERPLVFPDHQ